VESLQSGHFAITGLGVVLDGLRSTVTSPALTSLNSRGASGTYLAFLGTGLKLCTVVVGTHTLLLRSGAQMAPLAEPGYSPLPTLQGQLPENSGFRLYYRTQKVSLDSND